MYERIGDDILTSEVIEEELRLDRTFEKKAVFGKHTMHDIGRVVGATIDACITLHVWLLLIVVAVLTDIVPFNLLKNCLRVFVLFTFSMNSIHLAVRV